MNLSQGEKLVLLALAAKEDGKEDLDLAFIRSAILSGNTWALSWELSGVPTEDKSPADAKETIEIMNMWRFVEQSVEALSDADREQLKRDSSPYSLTFEGFDGNNDAHYGIARFLVKNMNRFEDFSSRSLNSHSQSSLPHYRSMLSFYDETMRTRPSSGPLSTEQIRDIVTARKK